MSTPKKKVRRHKQRISNRVAALIGIVVVLFACYMVFDGNLPFEPSTYVLKAVFTSNTDLHLPSPVRIAGVNVGEVVHVDRLPGSTDAGVVVMDIDENGLPLHADATATIRTRTFLEGNYYVQLSPGTPESPILKSGSTLPAANTSGPVQLDRVLSALNSNARSDLQRLVQGLGSALNGPSTAADQTGQAPADKDMTGAQALNYALNYSANAFAGAAIVNQALLGEKPHDLSGAIAAEAKVFTALARSGNSLGTLIDGFDKTMSALASQQGALSETIAVLPSLLKAADGADSALDASFAPTRQFARDLTPSIKQLPATIAAMTPWLKQATLLTSSSELGGVVKYLSPAVDNTAAAVVGLKSVTKQLNLLSECFTDVLVPDGNETITVDPTLGADKLYQQLFSSAVGIASATGDFDGNGRYGRVAVAGGSDLVNTKPVADGDMYGNAVLSPLGTFPSWPGSGATPALDWSVPCYTQSAPDLNAATEGTGP